MQWIMGYFIREEIHLWMHSFVTYSTSAQLHHTVFKSTNTYTHAFTPTVYEHVYSCAAYTRDLRVGRSLFCSLAGCVLPFSGSWWAEVRSDQMRRAGRVQDVINQTCKTFSLSWSPPGLPTDCFALYFVFLIHTLDPHHLILTYQYTNLLTGTLHCTV